MSQLLGRHRCGLHLVDHKSSNNRIIAGECETVTDLNGVTAFGLRGRLTSGALGGGGMWVRPEA